MSGSKASETVGPRAALPSIECVIDGCDAGIAVVDEARRLVLMNQWLARLADVDAAACLGEPFATVFGVAPGARLLRALDEALDAGRAGMLSARLHPHPLPLYRSAAARAEGRLIHQVISVRPVLVEGRRHAVVHVTDVTASVAREQALRDSFGTLGRLADELRESERQVRFLAFHDPLTGLANRTLFQDRLGLAVEEHRRRDETLAVLFVDLDLFKRINDRLGHAVGDALLQAVAERLRGELRATDTVARMGGDEFAIILPGLREPTAAGLVAGKILEAVRGIHEVAGHEVSFAASIGVSCMPLDAADATALINNADIAMYEAKRAGGAAWRYFSSDMRDRIERRETLQQEMAGAIARREFLLHFQPQIDLATGHCAAVEALLRWRRADGRLVPPADFIPAAEDNGLIGELGRYVREEVVAAARAWAVASPRTVPRFAVNLSPVELRDPDLAHQLLDTHARLRAEGSGLEVELTETVVMHDVEQAQRILGALAAAGVCVSVDDFGTGYSSLAYLRRLPVQRLKIDRTFVRDIETDADDARVVQAIVGLAHSLGRSVVAEGVETAGQVAFLSDLGCETVQGWYYARPLPLEAILAWASPAASAA